MTSRTRQAIRWAKLLVLAAMIAWSVYAWWAMRQVRGAGSALCDTVAAWPEDGGPPLGTREALLAAAEKLRDGRFRRAAADLGPAKPLSAEERIAVQRFFAESPLARERFLAVAAAARTQQTEGADVGAVRDALARALVAGARRDEATVATHLQLAERALDEMLMPAAAGPGGNDRDAVVALVEQIGPAFRLGGDLMTEGHAAAEKLVRRASWHFQAGQSREAARLLSLAAGLLGVELAPVDTAEVPPWFEALAQEPASSKTEGETAEVVEICESMAMSETPARPVMTLIQKARHELEAGRPDEAAWWASVAMDALGMTGDTLAATTETPEDESPE